MPHGHTHLRYNSALCYWLAGTTMEINPYLNRIKDLTERTESLRGYL